MGAIPAAAGKHRAHGALPRARWRSGRCEALRPDVRWRAAFGLLHPPDAESLAGGGLHDPPALAELALPRAQRFPPRGFGIAVKSYELRGGKGVARSGRTRGSRVH